MSKQLGDYVWRDIWLSLPVCVFDKMRCTNFTFKKLNKGLEKWSRLKNEIFDIKYANTRICLESKYCKFLFDIYDNGSFYIWDLDDRLLGETKISYEKAPDEKFIKWLETIIDNYHKGIVSCSDCGCKMDTSEIAGRFFAGIYCKKCWDKTWKHMASSESYE